VQRFESIEGEETEQSDDRAAVAVDKLDENEGSEKHDDDTGEVEEPAVGGRDDAAREAAVADGGGTLARREESGRGAGSDKERIKEGSGVGAGACPDCGVAVDADVVDADVVDAVVVNAVGVGADAVAVAVADEVGVLDDVDVMAVDMRDDA